MQKRSIGVAIIGWLIIISNIFYLLPLVVVFRPIAAIYDKFSPSPAITISVAFNLVPIYLLNIFPPPNLVVTFLISVFFLFIGTCLLRLVNLVRIIVIIMSSVIILEEIAWLIKGNPNKPIIGWIIIALFIIVHSAYIYYLTRPKIREQFR